MEIDWSKAPGAQWYCQGDFYKREDRKWYWSCGNGQWSETDYASPENFGWWGHRVKTPEQWSGEGLPPVGTMCEFYDNEGDWRRCEIVAHRNEMAIVYVSASHIFASQGGILRPIRTPEQIAAEEREKGINDICQAANERITEEVAGLIFDAGYRKQEPTK